MFSHMVYKVIFQIDFGSWGVFSGLVLCGSYAISKSYVVIDSCFWYRNFQAASNFPHRSNAWSNVTWYTNYFGTWYEYGYTVQYLTRCGRVVLVDLSFFLFYKIDILNFLKYFILDKLIQFLKLYIIDFIEKFYLYTLFSCEIRFVIFSVPIH